jgi:hypothetical protein
VIKKDWSSFFNKTHLNENDTSILPSSSSKSIQSNRIPIADLPDSASANHQTSAAGTHCHGTALANYL